MIYSGVPAPATLMQKDASVPFLLLYYCCGTVPITATSLIKSSAKIKQLEGKLQANTYFSFGRKENVFQIRMNSKWKALWPGHQPLLVGAH